jgi:hypothetical protein
MALSKLVSPCVAEEKERPELRRISKPPMRTLEKNGNAECFQKPHRSVPRWNPFSRPALGPRSLEVLFDTIDALTPRWRSEWISRLMSPFPDSVLVSKQSKRIAQATEGPRLEENLIFTPLST